MQAKNEKEFSPQRHRAHRGNLFYFRKAHLPTSAEIIVNKDY
jgi:hypothetical protein